VSDTASGLHRPRGGKSREAFRTISEVAEELDLPQHVLRFWESKFSQIKPLKRGGNRRYYRPDDVTLLKAIKKLLHADGYTIRGVQKLFKAQGLKATVADALQQDTGVADAEPGTSTESGDPPTQKGKSLGTKETPFVPAEVIRPVRGEGGLSEAEKSKLADVLASLKALRASLD